MHTTSKFDVPFARNAGLQRDLLRLLLPRAATTSDCPTRDGAAPLSAILVVRTYASPSAPATLTHGNSPSCGQPRYRSESLDPSFEHSQTGTPPRLGVVRAQQNEPLGIEIGRFGFI